ncbi:MAG: hypothetical protein WC693_07140 [Patescibacteria group bacterium]|jgi:hypothetical protein
MPEPFEKPISPEIIPQQPLEKEQSEGDVEIEKELEQLEKEINKQEKQIHTVTASLPIKQMTPTKPVIVKTITRKKIEGILSEDLKELFQGMDAVHKAEFKRQAAETASALEILVATAKATAKKVAKLISAWLKSIPGINSFFLEQEAKLKTDKILAMTKANKEENNEPNN